MNGGDCVGQKDADETEEGRPGLLTVGGDGLRGRSDPAARCFAAGESGGLVNTTAAGF